jgi:hypothetical protein
MGSTVALSPDRSDPVAQLRRNLLGESLNRHGVEVVEDEFGSVQRSWLS